jgi:hypothetical protein
MHHISAFALINKWSVPYFGKLLKPLCGVFTVQKLYVNLTGSSSNAPKGINGALDWFKF